MVPMAIANTKIVGRMVCANSRGILVPTSITDEEMDALKEGIPDSVRIEKVDEKLSALGNCIVCNDRVALVHPELDQETENKVAEVLGVEVYR